MRKFTNLKGRVVRLEFSPEGTTLTAAVRGAMRLGMWDWPGGKFRRWHPYINGAASTFAYSPDGKWLVVGGDGGLVLPYRRVNDNYDSEMNAGQPVDSVAFSSRVVPGHTVAAVGGNRVRLYDLDAPNLMRMGIWNMELPSLGGWFRSVAFHPTEDVLVGCETLEGGLHVWNPVTRERLRRTIVRKSAPTAAAFSTSGERLLVAYASHAQLLDTSTWETAAECKHPRGVVTGLAASPCGRWFATAGTDGSVRLWDSSTGEAARVYDWKLNAVTAIAFAPDGLTCVAGAADGAVVVWDVDA